MWYTVGSGWLYELRKEPEKNSALVADVRREGDVDFFTKTFRLSDSERQWREGYGPKASAARDARLSIWEQEGR